MDSSAVVNAPIATPWIARNTIVGHGPSSSAYPANAITVPSAPRRSHRWRRPPSTRIPTSGRVTIPAMPNDPTTIPTSQAGSSCIARGISTSDIV